MELTDGCYSEGDWQGLPGFIHPRVLGIPTIRGYPSQRMHSKGMYLGLQGTRILVGFWWVSATSEHARGWSHGICHIVESLGRRGDCACSGLVL